MIRNIFKSIEVLIDMYYHRKKLRFRYKRIKRYQRKGERANISKIDKIRDRDLDLLNNCLQMQLKTILKDADVKADMFNNGTVGITVWYNGNPFNKRTYNYYDFSSNLNNCMNRVSAIVQEIKNQKVIEEPSINEYKGLEFTIVENLNISGIKVNISGGYSKPVRIEVCYKDCSEWFEISQYIPKNEFYNKILPEVEMITHNLIDRQHQYELNERIKLNSLEGEVKRLIREAYPYIEVELQKDYDGKGYYLLLKRYGMSSAKYVMKNSSKQLYLELASDFNNKVDREIQKKQQEKDKKKALFKKNNPLNLKVGELYRIRYKYSTTWNLVSITKTTEDGFPYCVAYDSRLNGILNADLNDVKTHDGKWIHNRKAWEEFQAKKNRKKYIAKVVSNTLETKPQFLWDYRTYNHNGIKLQTIIH